MRVEFDDERVVSDAGVMLVATLAARLGIEALAQQLVRLRRERPGAANAGRKVMALIYAMVLGADSIDDTDLLRAGSYSSASWAAGYRPSGKLPRLRTGSGFLSRRRSRIFAVAQETGSHRQEPADSMPLMGAAFLTAAIRP